MMRTLTADEYATYHYTKALACVCTEIFFPPPVFNLWSVFLGSTGGLSFRRLLDIRVLFFFFLFQILKQT